MNRDKIIALLQDGAYLKVSEFRFYHPSFRKGYRSMSAGDISFCAARKALGERVALIDGIYKLV